MEPMEMETAEGEQTVSQFEDLLLAQEVEDIEVAQVSERPATSSAILPDYLDDQDSSEDSTNSHQGLVDEGDRMADIASRCPRKQIPKQSKKKEEDEEGEAVSLQEYALTITTILRPVAITMILVIILVKIMSFSPEGQAVSVVFVYNEQTDDAPALKFGGAILNAVIFLAIILVTTIVFVILYKFRCIKVIIGWLITTTGLMLMMFGAVLFFMLLDAVHFYLDYITAVVLVLNFGVVGIIAIFWAAPMWLNQAYLITVSVLMATFFTRLPEWTTWAILIVVALYDIFAVLCPKGPLKILVETAQKRKEPIPALLYNTSIGVFMADDEPDENAHPMQGAADLEAAAQAVETEERKGVKLGLGDFVFYSVLVGRAALFDILTVFTCFIAIITGLFFTLILLGVFKKALPALPISIGLGAIFYFLSRIFLLPYLLTMGAQDVFV